MQALDMLVFRSALGGKIAEGVTIAIFGFGNFQKTLVRIVHDERYEKFMEQGSCQSRNRRFKGTNTNIVALNQDNLKC